jgi:hypothetical protein
MGKKKGIQQPHDRPDLLARVFRQKLMWLKDQLLKKEIFGGVVAWLYSIEYQKRGLPHCHMLLWMATEDKIRPDAIDKVISAEVPDPNGDPELFKIVTSHMVHGPCGQLNPSSPCMRDGKCTKGYPKPFIAHTEQGKDSYPTYRRRSPADGGFTAKKKTRVHGQTKEICVDNQ